MTVMQWENYGYRVYFVDGFVYLYRPVVSVGYFTAVDEGRWMVFQNPNRLPWRFISYRLHPQLLEKFCNLDEARKFMKAA